jgi:predicted RNA binding protein YcfA (HicA-like mRNA interferase family)
MIGSATGSCAFPEVYLNGRQTVIPMHSTDLNPGTLAAIKRQLGLKD